MARLRSSQVRCSVTLLLLSRTPQHTVRGRVSSLRPPACTVPKTRPTRADQPTATAWHFAAHAAAASAPPSCCTARREPRRIRRQAARTPHARQRLQGLLTARVRTSRRAGVHAYNTPVPRHVVSFAVSVAIEDLKVDVC
jgi:hypothetical protein